MTSFHVLVCCSYVFFGDIAIQVLCSFFNWIICHFVVVIRYILKICHVPSISNTLISKNRFSSFPWEDLSPVGGNQHQPNDHLDHSSIALVASLLGRKGTYLVFSETVIGI